MPTVKRKHKSKKRSTRKNRVKKISPQMFRKLKALSPFELNYQLIKMAGPNALNAGRGIYAFKEGSNNSHMSSFNNVSS